jgi:hypothetical protein
VTLSTYRIDGTISNLGSSGFFTTVFFVFVSIFLSTAFCSGGISPPSKAFSTIGRGLWSSKNVAPATAKSAIFVNLLVSTKLVPVCSVCVFVASPVCVPFVLLSVVVLSFVVVALSDSYEQSSCFRCWKIKRKFVVVIARHF